MPPQAADAAPCTKCAQPTELLTIMPALGEHPSYHIRRCLGCGYVNWFAQPREETAKT
jgi:hypothetical protein